MAYKCHSCFTKSQNDLEDMPSYPEVFDGRNHYYACFECNAPIGSDNFADDYYTLDARFPTIREE